MPCKLCDGILKSDGVEPNANNPNVKFCSNEELHRGKLQIVQLLRELAICPVSENRAIVSQIKQLEIEYDVPEIERYDFTLPAAKFKFDLSEADTQ